MSGEALVLALCSIVRPTTLAAVYTMLSGRNARRLLIAYLMAGLAFSLGVGTVVVLVLHGHESATKSTAWRAGVDIALGAAACGYAAGAWTRRRSEPSAPTSRMASWMQERLKHPTVAGAALIGVVTHLPGLVYIAALNAIVRASASTSEAMLQVVVYNLIWYSLAIAALLASAFHLAISPDALDNVQAAIRQHRRTIVVACFGGLGIYLVGKGLAVLLDW